MLTQERLKELLCYEPLTGVFTWLKPSHNMVKAGDIAGTINLKGYIVISIDSKLYRGHRLSFLYMEGKLPMGQVDHINHVRTDNRWCNIIHASNKSNAMNRGIDNRNTSGFTGVIFDKVKRNWRAQLMTDGKCKYLGNFKTFYAACYARHAANFEYGFHQNHGAVAK